MKMCKKYVIGNYMVSVVEVQSLLCIYSLDLRKNPIKGHLCYVRAHCTRGYNIYGGELLYVFRQLLLEWIFHQYSYAELVFFLNNHMKLRLHKFKLYGQ